MADKNLPRGLWPKVLVEQTSQTAKEWCAKWYLEQQMKSSRERLLLEEKLLSCIEEQGKPIETVTESE